jgi:hypothetical protein
VDAAGQLVLQRGQGRFERHAGRGVQRLLAAAERGLIFQLPPGAVEGNRIAIHHQLAIALIVEVQRLALDQFMHAIAAELAQPEQLRGDFLGHAGAAGTQELEAPGPLAPIKARNETQGRVAVEQPSRQLGQHGRVGQRRHVAVAELRAIGQAGFLGQFVARFQQGNGMPLARQIVGARDANHSATQYAYPHVSLPTLENDLPPAAAGKATVLTRAG